MADIDHNLSEIAREFQELPSSLADLLDSMEGFVEEINNAFTSDELSNLQPFVHSYNQAREEVRNLKNKSQMLLRYLNGDREPSEPDDIDSINIAVHSLIKSIDEFVAQAQDITGDFVKLGLDEQAEALEEIGNKFSQVSPAIKESLINNQLLFVLKAQYFPDAAGKEISDHVDRLDELNSQGRQNTYGAIGFVASANPEAVVEYTDEFVNRLSDASREEKRNILGMLNLVTKADSAPDRVAVDQALELIHSDDETIALYAAMLLGGQATTERQAKLISRRIANLLGTVQEDEARINATSVLCELAESYPAQVQDLIPDVANLIEGQHPSTQANAIEFLELTNSVEYRESISNICSKTTDEAVRKAADSALDAFNENEPSGDREGSEASTVGTDSILAEIEDEFSQL